MADLQPNPYQSPSEPSSEQPPVPPRLVRRHPVLSVLGWLLAVTGLLITGFFVFLTVALFNLNRYQEWMGILAVLSFSLVFGILFALMFVLVTRTAPKANWWANVLPSVLWTLALVFAGEVTFFTLCTMLS